MKTEVSKFGQAFYLVPTVMVEWTTGKSKTFTIGIEWLRWGAYLEI